VLGLGIDMIRRKIMKNEFMKDKNFLLLFAGSLVSGV